MDDKTTPARGGYYLNGLRADAAALRKALRLGAARSKRLHSIGSSIAEDHDAAMAVKREMLAVVERALANG